MALWYLAAIFAVLASYTVKRAAIPRLDNALAVEVIFGAKDREGSMPPIFAHRGGADDAPENTLAAFREAKRNNASGVEFDVSFTQDSVAVLFHDDTLERTTNGVGPLASVTFEDLRRLDASCKHPLANNFTGERVPTLEEGVKECIQLDLRLIVDVKEYDHRAVKVVDELFRQRPALYRRALVASFYPQFIYDLRCHNPNIVTALTWRPGFLAFEDMENRRPRFQSRFKHSASMAADWLLDAALHSGLLPHLTGASALLISTNQLSPEYVRAWRNHGVHVIAWTPNDRTEKDYLRHVLRVPIITDSVRQA